MTPPKKKNVEIGGGRKLRPPERLFKIPIWNLKERKDWEGKVSVMNGKNDFDLYLEEQLKDRAFAERFKKASEAWDVAMQLADLRKKSGISQAEKKSSYRVK